MADKQNDSSNLIDPMGFDPKVQAAAGMIGKTSCKIFEITSGVSDPTGAVSESVAQFAKAVAPVAIGASRKLMENVYAQTALPGDRFLREHPLRSADGTPLTIEEGKQLAFKEVDEYGVVKDTNSGQSNSGYSGGIKR